MTDAKPDLRKLPEPTFERFAELLEKFGRDVTIGQFMESYAQLSAERDALKAEVERLKLALFSVARDVHEANEDHVITRFTECNHSDCEAVHNLLGDMPHPTEAELKAALEVRGNG